MNGGPSVDREAWRERLWAGVRELGLALTPDQGNRLLDYLALLQRWNRVYNLTAVRAPAQMLTHHLLDSLAVVGPLQRYADGRALRLLDVGSGGGLPGVVVAITCPALTVHCVDAVAKKATFVRQVAVQLGLRNLQGVHARIETLRAGEAGDGYDIVCSRAFASLADFTAWSRAALNPGGIWMAMKGRHPAEEIAALPSDVAVFHVEPVVVPGLDAERCIVWMRPAASAARP
jgi:16S rRNA (guanine527-N7)-methyltransferase